ncbi:hypothetical protein OP10G_1038 [Fimbriimonas ginsengisoli Gsoil 348]|uniref:Uncharacterized protein n=1 Tax=Fimbriimonas ginsengisoli Gsoil 348 TaxID=661478 RepID=A0A068NLQ2_FIMGI|nr:hypothetical protein OP10G_1038 [Fimbriimonas ginsengisoli Gsoil 348]
MGGAGIKLDVVVRFPSRSGCSVIVFRRESGQAVYIEGAR